MYYTYVIKSKRDGRWYTGSTNELRPDDTSGLSLTGFSNGVYNRLLKVQKPARYIGEEYNSIKKDWNKIKIKFLLCFPDIYEIGASNLGIIILYGLLNSMNDVLCERCFAPWQDMEKILRETNTALFSLETKHPMFEFDVIGFSLQHELNYTNVLNMLDLGRVKIWQKERRKDEPLVIAGGPVTINPEPLADIFDLILIGETENSILELLDLIRKDGAKLREEFLKEASKIDGCYVPSIYDLRRTKFGFVVPDIKDRIKKTFVKNLDTSFYPMKPIVPYIQVVHDRLNLEIMRGCPHFCRFCQARNYYYPLRIRKKENILNIALKSYKFTGYENICFSSLSSGDYPNIVDLIDSLLQILSKKRVFLSLPSLWVKNNIFQILDRLSIGKRPGLTFAPEVATDKMKKIVNKYVDEKLLLKIINYASYHGWRRVKLYYMIGLPGLKKDDLLAIRDYIIRIFSSTRGGFKVKLGISTFIPKPHTPFQWFGFVKDNDIKEQISLIKRRLKMPGVEISIHDFLMSKLEAIISRGDRELSKVIYSAWEKGARFDSWGENFSWQIWEKAFQSVGIDYNIYLKGYDRRIVFPWSHIDGGIEESILWSEYCKAMKELKINNDYGDNFMEVKYES
jgi:radical SAM family uncharacterized protein